MKRVMHFTVRQIYWTVCCIAIALAAFITVSSRLLPHLDNYRQNFEKFSTSFLHQPVKIGYVSAWWEGVEPVLRFNDVSILSKDGTQNLVTISHIQINIKILRSLLNWGLEVESLRIVGADLQVKQLKSGRLQVMGLSDFQVSGTVSNQNIDTASLLDWLFSQPNLMLRHINIDWLSDQPAVPVKIDTLRLTNNNAEHVLSGQLLIKENGDEDLQFNLTVNGSLKKPEELAAKIYVHLKNVALEKWLSYFPRLNNTVESGIVDGKLWAWWSHGKLQKSQLLFQMQDTVLHSLNDTDHYSLPYAYGHLGWRRLGDSSAEIAGENLLLSFPQHTLPLSEFRVVETGFNTPDSNIKIWLSYLNVSDLSKLFLDSRLPCSYTQWIEKLSPVGILQDVKINFQGKLPTVETTHVTASFYDIGFLPFDSIPGVGGLAGDVSWENNHGTVNILTANAVMADEKLFLHPVDLQFLSGHLDVRQNNDGWKISASDIYANDNVMRAYGNFSLNLPSEGSPDISLLAAVQSKDISTLVNYLPIKKLNLKFKAWLMQAFLQGKAYATITWHGVIDNKFPYAKDPSAGTFIMDSALSDINLRFNDEWPILENMQGHLAVLGNRLSATAQAGGSMLDAAIKAMAFEISHVAEKEESVLLLQGRVTADARQAANIISHSPLRHTLGKVLAEDSLNGSLDLHLQLEIPFKHVEEELAIFGQVNLAGNRYRVAHLPWVLENVSGQLRFDEKNLLPSVLQASLMGSPAKIDIMTLKKDNEIYLQGSIDSTMAVAALEKHLYPALGQYVFGKIPLTATFTSRLAGEQQRTQIQLASDLVGTSIYLPKPLGKLLPESRKLTVDVKLNDDMLDSVAINYKDNVRGILRFNLDADHGLVTIADGYVSVFDGEEWQTFINQQASSKNNTEKLKHYVASAQLKINNFSMYNQKLSDLKLLISHDPTHWLLNVDSEKAKGDIIVPDNVSKEPLTLEMQRLYLQPLFPLAAKSGALSPQDMLPIMLHVTDFRYSNQDLGETTLSLSRIQEGIKINTLTTRSKSLTLDAQGQWLIKDKRSESRFSGKMQSDNLQKLFTQWNYQSSLMGSTAKVTFDLSWPDLPYAMSVDELQGSVSVELGRGSIVNLNQATTSKLSVGRLLNVLSVETITRRLTLDFSDLSKGYNFNTLKGNGAFNRGLLKIDSLIIDGLVADVDLAGIIDVKDKNYSLQLNLTPRLTSSLPIVAGIVTVNPLIGVATYVVDKLLSQEVNKLTTYHYIVTGSWDNPVVTLVDKKH